MKKPRKSEVTAAKKAVVTAVKAAFGVNRVRLYSQEVASCIEPLVEFGIRRCEPIPGSRTDARGEPLECVAPSFWHASAYLLGRWLATRLLRHEFDSKPAADSFGNHYLFRGQTHPWPLQPSAWRDPAFRDGGHGAIRVFRDYIQSHLPRGRIPGVAGFSPLSSLDCAAALAQHYGFPTNNLDFTFHPLVALHFANAASPAASPPDHPMAGHAVVYYTNFYGLGYLPPNKFEIRLPLPPPWAMRRWYQQIGIHIDCGSPTESGQVASEFNGLERRCRAVFFPRTYPDAAVGNEIVAPLNLSQWLSHGAWESYSAATLSVQYLWYEPQPFFESPLGGLRSYCESASARFSDAAAARALRASASGSPPWPMDNGGYAGHDLLIAAADPARIGANYLIDAAGICSAEGLHFDPIVLTEFARCNDDFFQTFRYLADNVDLYDLPTISQLFARAFERRDTALAQKST